MSIHRVGEELVAFSVTMGGVVDTFIANFSHILGCIALLLGTIWYAINIYDWYKLHRITTITRTETHSIAGIIPATKVTTEVTSVSAKSSPPDIPGTSI